MTVQSIQNVSAAAVAAAGAELTANKDQANGYAGLSGGLISTSQLPALAITDVFTVASQAAMLALTAEKGDVAVRTDVGKTFILSSTSPSTLADWKEISAVGVVTSIAGRTGAVTLTEADLTLSDITTNNATTSAHGLLKKLSNTATEFMNGAGNWATPSFEPLGAVVGINTQTASYTAVLGDAGKVIELNNASANNFTVPLNSSVAFAVNTRIDLVQYGAGQTTIVATVGVTLRSSGSKLKLTGQYSGASLYKRGTDEWVVIGDLAA